MSTRSTIRQHMPPLTAIKLGIALGATPALIEVATRFEPIIS